MKRPRRSLWLVIIAVVAGLTACGGGGGGGSTSPADVLDQENLLDGDLGGQGIGRFSNIDGSPDPTGANYDFQDAQTFTVGVTGTLTRVRVAVINSKVPGGNAPLLVDILAVDGGVPDVSSVLATVSIPIASVPTDGATLQDPTQWPEADFTPFGIAVTSGQLLSYAVRTLSTIGYLYNPESTLGYAGGSGFRRNAATMPTYTTGFRDFGFQTFVQPSE